MWNNIGTMYSQWRQKYGSKCTSMAPGVSTPGPPEKATSPVQIQVLAVQDNLLDRNSTTVPADLLSTLKTELSNANIQPTIIDAQTLFKASDRQSNGWMSLKTSSFNRDQSRVLLTTGRTVSMERQL